MVLKEFFRKYGWLYLPGGVFLCLNTYLQTYPPKILGEVVDVLGTAPIDREGVLQGIGAMVLAALAIFLTRVIWRYMIIGNSRNMENFVRQRLFEQFQLLSVDFYNHHRTGDLIAYAINDINAVRMMFGPGLALGVSGLGTGLIAILRMFTDVNPRLAAFALLPVPFLVVANMLLGRTLRARFRRVQETFAEVSGRVNENISGIRVIKAYVQESKEVERFEELNRRVHQANMDMVKVVSVRGPLVTLVFGVSFAICLLYGGQLVRQGVISLGDFVAFNGYLTLIIHPVMSIVRIGNILQRGMASYRRIEEIFLQKPAVKDVEVSARDSLRGEVEVKNLTFTYPDAITPALKNVHFHIQPGHSLGILGRTGSGKTTLTNLLVRLYEAPEGTIFLDGADIRSLSLDVLRRDIGYAPQDNYLFSTTIDENIRFFGAEFTKAQVEQAARDAAIYDNVMEFPEGFATQVGERGATLSGGQKQRIGLARALIKRPALLVLDDALSAVDTRTEQEIQQNLRAYLEKGASAVLIAHRVSALARCDEILVLDKGEIVERGTHEELMALGGLYASIAEEQKKGDAIAGEESL